MVSIRSINTSEQEILIATINQPARKALQLLLVDGTPTVHNVYFVKYDVTVSFMAQVLDTVAYFVSHVLVVDTVTCFDIFL